MHVAEYLIDAGRVIAGPENAVSWGMERKNRMLGGNYDKVLAELAEHKCHRTCAKNESGKCLVTVAHGYLKNNGRYMQDYENLLVRRLPVGSGEADSGIRHIIKRRMAVAGAWEESAARLLLALLAIRASRWWGDFWQWRTQRDRQAWHDRHQGKIKVLFRGGRRKQHKPKAA